MNGKTERSLGPCYFAGPHRASFQGRAAVPGDKGVLSRAGAAVKSLGRVQNLDSAARSRQHKRRSPVRTGDLLDLTTDQADNNCLIFATSDSSRARWPRMAVWFKTASEDC